MLSVYIQYVVSWDLVPLRKRRPEGAVELSPHLVTGEREGPPTRSVTMPPEYIQLVVVLHRVTVEAGVCVWGGCTR